MKVVCRWLEAEKACSLSRTARLHFLFLNGQHRQVEYRAKKMLAFGTALNNRNFLN